MKLYYSLHILLQTNIITKEMAKVTKKACMDVLTQYVKTLPNITAIANFTHELLDLIEHEKDQFREKSNIPTSEDVCNLVKNKDSMKNVIDALKKIENKLDREFAGLDVIEVENFRVQYTRKEKKQFLKVIDREDIDINDLEPPSNISEKDMCKLVENNEPMKKIISTLKKIKDKNHREYVSLYVIEVENFKHQYTKEEKEKFVKAANIQNIDIDDI